MSPAKRSRTKGANGERELAEFFRMFGFEARRGIQFAGEPDVVHDLAGFHVESKRCERLRIPEWLDQAEADALRFSEEGAPLVPLVFSRQNRRGWIAHMPAGSLLELLGDLYRLRNLEKAYLEGLADSPEPEGLVSPDDSWPDDLEEEVRAVG